MYDEDIKQYFETNRNSEGRIGWILMDKIKAPTQQNYILKAGSENPIYASVAGELGIFGVVIG